MVDEKGTVDRIGIESIDYSMKYLLYLGMGFIHDVGNEVDIMDNTKTFDPVPNGHIIKIAFAGIAVTAIMYIVM